MERWQLEDKIEKIVNKNCVEVSWEGTEVNKSGLREDILNLIDEIKKDDIENLRKKIKEINFDEDTN